MANHRVGMVDDVADYRVGKDYYSTFLSSFSSLHSPCSAIEGFECDRA